MEEDLGVSWKDVRSQQRTVKRRSVEPMEEDLGVSWKDVRSQQWTVKRRSVEPTEEESVVFMIEYSERARNVLMK